MNAQTIIGRALLALVAPLAAYVAAHYKQPELGGLLSAGIAAIGGELLLRQSPPGTVSLPKNAGISGGSLLVLLLALPFLHGCALSQKPSTQRIVKCTGDVVSACKADVMPTVAACLAAPANPTPCLLALLETGRCATVEALACKAREATTPLLTFVSPTDAEADAAEHRRMAAQRFYSDVHVTPIAPLTP